MRSAKLLGVGQLIIHNIHRHKLLDLKVRRSHQRSDANAPHAKDDNRLSLIRLERVEHRASPCLKAAAQGGVVWQRLGVWTLDDASLGHNRQPREGRVPKELTPHRSTVLKPSGSRAVREADRANVHGGVDVTEGWLTRDALLALAADVEGEEDMVADLEGLILDVAA